MAAHQAFQGKSSDIRHDTHWQGTVMTAVTTTTRTVSHSSTLTRRLLLPAHPIFSSLILTAEIVINTNNTCRFPAFFPPFPPLSSNPVKQGRWGRMLSFLFYK